MKFRKVNIFFDQKLLEGLGRMTVSLKKIQSTFLLFEMNFKFTKLEKRCNTVLPSELWYAVL
jgi:hypothetical protein